MNRWIRLGIIVFVIAVMVVALVVLQNRPDEPPETQEVTTGADDTERITLLENPREEIARIEIATRDSELVLVPSQEEGFRPVYEYDVAFDQRRVSRIANTAASMTSRRVIGEVDDLTEYGLADPSATVTVTRDDGTQQQLLLGDRTPARNGYYAKKPGEQAVYTVFNTWVSPFFSTLDSLRVRAIPQITMEQLDRVRISTVEGRTIRISQIPQYEEDPEMSIARFAVTEPFGRRFQANQGWLQDLDTDLQSLRINEFVDDSPTDLATYGLAPPVGRIVVADMQNTLDLLVGNETEGGRFAKFAETPSVFVLSGAEPIITTEPYDTISAFTLIVNIDIVDSFVVEAPGARYVGEIERTPVEGEEEPEESYYLNGEEIEEDRFKELYQWAIGLQFDVEMDAPQQGLLEARDPIARITYNLNTDTEPLQVAFVPQSNNFSAVVREGRAEFLIATRKIERMLEAFATAAADVQ